MAEDLQGPVSFFERMSPTELFDYLERLMYRKIAGEDVKPEWNALKIEFKRRKLTR